MEVPNFGERSAHRAEGAEVDGSFNLLDARLMLDLGGFAAAVSTDMDVRMIALQNVDPDFFVPHGDMRFVDDPGSFANLKVGEDQDERLNLCSGCSSDGAGCRR